MAGRDRQAGGVEAREASGKPGRHSLKNGGGRATAFATVAGAPLPYDDPMSKVLGLDAKTSSVGAWFGFTSGSTLLLVGLMALTSVVAWIHTMRERQAASVPDEIEVMKEDAPPPPPPPPQEEEKKAEPVVPHLREAPPPPPAPAQAAKVLTQEPTPDEPIDLTGNTIVQGNADSYAGGFTSATGSNANAVRTLTGPTGVVGGRGAVRPAASAVKPDLSRAVSFEATNWGNCDFPDEADGINDERVGISIDVRADGTPAAVRVYQDPGNGFGVAATKCAMRKKAAPALDKDGNPIPSTAKVVVHFTR